MSDDRTRLGVAVIGGAEGVELWALDPFDGSTIAVNLASLRAPSPSGGDFTWFG